MLVFLKELWQTVSDFAVHQLLPAALIFTAGFLAAKILLKVLKKLFEKTKMEQMVVNLIMAVIRVALYLVVTLATVSALGIDVTGIVALASVLTLALSLSLQDALTNLIGGFTLLYTKPFAMDDYVEIGGQAGTVKQIGLTYTRLQTSDGKIVSLPNSTVVAAQVINYTSLGKRRADISVNVAYRCDPEQVMAALLQAAQLPEVLQDPAPYTALTAYGESTVTYVLQVWTATENYWKVLHTINRNIRTSFREMQVEMTYPHLNIHLEK